MHELLYQSVTFFYKSINKNQELRKKKIFFKSYIVIYSALMLSVSIMCLSDRFCHTLSLVNDLSHSDWSKYLDLWIWLKRDEVIVRYVNEVRKCIGILIVRSSLGEEVTIVSTYQRQQARAQFQSLQEK